MGFSSQNDHKPFSYDIKAVTFVWPDDDETENENTSVFRVETVIIQSDLIHNRPISGMTL